MTEYRVRIGYSSALNCLDTLTLEFSTFDRGRAYKASTETLTLEIDGEPYALASRVIEAVSLEVKE